MELFVKDFFSFVNVGLILYLLTGRQEKEDKAAGKPTASKIMCFLLFLGIRFFENWFGTHIFWVYVTTFVMSAVLGYVWEKHSVRYSLLISGAFLILVSLGWVAADVAFFWKAVKSRTDLCLVNGQSVFLAIMEIVIVTGVLCIIRIVRKVPKKIDRKSFVVVMFAQITNLAFLLLIGDAIYYNTQGYYLPNEPARDMQLTGSALFVGVIIAVGNIGSLSMLESYLNVKYIENDKNLRLTELNLQYDYYTRLERDMEQVRRLSHDIRNHLEALKGSNDEARKQEYIESIENHLKRFESYYKTGNTFIDSLLRRKKEEAAEQKIQFKVIADLRPFHSIKDEDLCVMIANALDNALRECTLRQGEELEAECLIQLKAGKVREFLSIVCENSMREGQAKRIQVEEELKTTKEDKEYHGYGIKNIEGAVHKYGGEMSIVVRDQMFCLSIMIPL